MLVAVLDAGTTTLRASLVDDDLRILATLEDITPMLRSRSGEASFDANELARRARHLLDGLARRGRADLVALTNQRASAVVFDPTHRVALAPGIGWEDARTAARCLELARHGVVVSPSESATKFERLLAIAELPDHAQVGTVDAWLVVTLTGSASTDPTNAAVTGLSDTEALAWDGERLALLGIAPERLVPIEPSVGPRGHVRLGGRDVPLVVVIGDQQAAHAGHPELTKLTIGTSAVADHWLGAASPPFARRGGAGSFPVVLVDTTEPRTFGLEAFWPAAGSTVGWLVRRGILADAAEATRLAERAGSAVPLVVPTFQGAGAPLWDLGARGRIEGLSAASGPAELTAGVLEGLAHVGVTLFSVLAADRAAAGYAPDLGDVALDGRAGHNPRVAGVLASLLGRPVALGVQPEATTIGAARLALGLPREAVPRGPLVEPGRIRPVHDHDSWRAALERSRGAVPALSAVAF
ncbi:Glycerol kinase [Acidimicrobium ferrooxidans DSM 10331]|uniref:Glycerol kinase n=1 Tax=Acidimicrobium ferrooxidans (strain DSM 10331 / JCM 15462 / NBRC 103882 / ICP) TaxID=525909 RepID=C7M087_ACIFD|nr:FGGY family carbohydrate kinase [Acidimicrobium ferrooxidans]ACU54395.1 Glycerol kinase [Acidimicrobium ferrooxidans DSM 10331]